MRNRKMTPVIDRLFDKIRVDDAGCWIFEGALTAQGYGSIGLGRRGEGADSTHRVVWEQTVGEIPEGLWTDHQCLVLSCCNPDHLELVTPGVNTMRGSQGRHGYCRQGHRMTEANTYVRPSGKTECRTCQRAVIRRSRARRTEGSCD